MACLRVNNVSLSWDDGLTFVLEWRGDSDTGDRYSSGMGTCLAVETKQGKTSSVRAVSGMLISCSGVCLIGMLVMMCL